MKKIGLSRAALKNIAIIAMLLDHIGYAFCIQYPAIYIILRTIGRTTAPIMCFFIVEGFEHTSSKLKYGATLLAFALISQIFYISFNSMAAWEINFNMLFTLFLCFLTLFILENVKDNILKVIYISLILIISNWCDWGIFAIIFTLNFYLNKNNQEKRITIALLMCSAYVIKNAIEFTLNGAPLITYIIPFGIFIPIVLLNLYNGEKGKDLLKSKYTYYIFYPLHQYILHILKSLI